MRIQAAPPSHFGWLVARTGCTVTSDFNAIEAVDGQGRVRGMVGYCNWTQNAVQLHIAADSKLAWKYLLRPGLEYPFMQLGKGLLLGIIRASNTASLRFAKSVGFVEAWRMEDGAAEGEDLLFLTLRREDCTYLPTERQVA